MLVVLSFSFLFGVLFMLFPRHCNEDFFVFFDVPFKILAEK